MTTTQIQVVKKIQEVFDINAIYARSVWRAIGEPKVFGTDEMNKAKKEMDEKPKPFVK